MFPLATARRPAEQAGPRSSGGDSLLARVPRLREASESIVAPIIKGLQTMAGPATTIEGMVAGFSRVKASDVVAAHRPHVAVGAVALKDLSLSILVTLDATLVHALVDLLCGGNGIEEPAVEPRPVTPIDQQFAHIVVTLVAAAIQAEWAGMGFGAARAAKVEGPLPKDIVGARGDEVGTVNITIGIFGLHGTLRLVLPQGALDRFGTTAAEATARADAPDPRWATRLQQELGRAPVALAAYLEAKDIPLSSIAGLRVGQILALPTDARTRATLISDGRVLYRGEVGQDDSRYSLRIDEIVSEPAHVARMAARRSPYFEASKAQ